jgi:thiol peroxidase
LKAGDQAPDFVTVGKDLKPVTLSDTQGEVRVFSVVPSLDTPICEAQTRRFNQEVTSVQGVKVYTISVDLPFAQTRWCAAAGVSNVVMLSDHRDASFGIAYGTLIKELRLECRAIFVLDKAGLLQHVEYVKEVAHHPNYEATLEAVRKLLPQ